MEKRGTDESLIPEDDFVSAWDENRTQAEKVLERAVRPPMMADKAWDDLKEEFSHSLRYTLSAGERMLGSCQLVIKKRQKKEAAKAAKAAKAAAAAAKKRSPRSVTKQPLLDEALKKIASFKYDIFDASQNGRLYLSAEELKQLAIHKNVYEPSMAVNKMVFVKALSQGNVFADEIAMMQSEVLEADDDA